MTRLQDCQILTGMTLRGCDIANAAVAMLEVVPVYEVVAPGAGVIKVGKAARREFRAVLGRLEQRFHEGVVVRDARARVRRFHAQPVQHGQHGGGLECTAVIAVQDRLAEARMNTLGERGALHEMDGVFGIVPVMDLPADDLAAVQIEDQVEVEPATLHLGR
jgi:hypothetical protein